jgi:hypothetical protein
MGFFKSLKLKRLRNKKDQLFELSFKYGGIDRKKSDEYYSQAVLIEDKIKKLLEE